MFSLNDCDLHSFFFAITLAYNCDYLQSHLQEDVASGIHSCISSRCVNEGMIDLLQ